MKHHIRALAGQRRRPMVKNIAFVNAESMIAPEMVEIGAPPGREVIQHAHLPHAAFE
jgi:hypothetical protein